MSEARLTVRMSRPDLELVRASASDVGMSLSELVRRSLMNEARRIKQGRPSVTGHLAPWDPGREDAP